MTLRDVCGEASRRGVYFSGVGCAEGCYGAGTKEFSKAIVVVAF